MERYGTLLFLLFSSFLDIRKREISIPVTLLFGLAGVVYSVRTGRTMTDYLIPLGIGILILGGSVLTRGQVEQFQKVGDIIRSDESRRYVVPSAPGKRFSADTKVTDLLYTCYGKAEAGEDFTDVDLRKLRDVFMRSSKA